ncbi:ribosomal-protein-alanine N-acetyltransferase [Streptococcus rupicaprae]|uniref:Ribosomal-protein-alanine N-acetyltransferase n=1 Tax=Streptococcus rupicaprae TaxID=759619 RepID=A0ABV2FFK1_9STRE
MPPISLSDRFSAPIAELFDQMIPAFQKGYADYVYQTDNPDVQKRRIKNLEKNFQKLLNKPSYYAYPLSPEEARELLKRWQITEPLPKVHAEVSFHLQILRNGALLGLCQVDIQGKDLLLHPHLTPEWMDQEIRQVFYQTLEDYLRNQYPGQTLRLILPSADSVDLDFFQSMGYESDHRTTSDAVHLIKSI